MRELYLLCAGLLVGLVWGIVMTYSHAFSFSEYFCRNCRDRRAKADTGGRDA